MLCSATLCSASTLKIQTAAGDISAGRHAGYQHVLRAHPLQRQQADKAADGQSRWECFGAHDRLLLPLLSTCGGDLIHPVLCHPSKEHPKQAYGCGEPAANNIRSSHPSINPSIHSSIHPSGCLFMHSIHPSIHSSIHASIHPSIHASVHFIHSFIPSSVKVCVSLEVRYIQAANLATLSWSASIQVVARAVLGHTVLCWAMLCCAVLGHAAMENAVLGHAVLGHAVWCVPLMKLFCQMHLRLCPAKTLCMLSVDGKLVTWLCVECSWTHRRRR